MTDFTRRGALGLLTAGAVGTIGVVGFVGTQTEGGLFRSVLEQYLGPLVITDNDMDAFIAHFRNTRSSLIPGAKLSDVWTAATRSGLPETARRLLPEGRSATIERFERWVLAEFHTVTDIGWRNGPDDPVAFLGPSACANPFAEFA